MPDDGRSLSVIRPAEDLRFFAFATRAVTLNVLPASTDDGGLPTRDAVSFAAFFGAAWAAAGESDRDDDAADGGPESVIHSNSL